MLKKLIYLTSLLISLSVYGQGDQTVINVTVGSGVTQQALLHLPDDYNSTSTKYPLLIFLHGAGEAGTDISKVYNAYGPSYYIARNQWPASFINPKDGQSYKFIVLSPQYASSANPTTGLQLDSILGYMYKNYRVDTFRSYITGLSDGGIGLEEHIGNQLNSGVGFLRRHKFAAAVPMSVVMTSSNRTTWAINMGIDSIYAWMFGSPTDTHGANTQGWDYIVNNKNPGFNPPLSRFTSYTGGHCCWNNFYVPTYTDNVNGVTMSIYQWMLQYRRSGTPEPPPPPKDSTHWIVQVIPSEYRCFVRSANGKVYSPYFDNTAGRTIPQLVNTGGRRILTGCGALYTALLFDSLGYVWMTNNSNNNATMIDVDTLGNPFDGNIDGGALTFTFFSIKNDGSVWMWGTDNYSIFTTDQSKTLKPIQITGLPVGKIPKKIIPTNAEVLILMKTGEVYERQKGSGNSWIKKTGIGPATDIMAIYEGAYVAIVPTDTAVSKNGYPWGWGKSLYLGSGIGTISTPINLTTAWNLTGNPITTIDGGENAARFITQDGRLWGFGVNTQGLVGNGYEFTNKRDSVANQYVYDYIRDNDAGFKMNRMVTPPVDISNGRTYKSLSVTSSSTTFYWYSIGTDDSLYFVGRTKSKVGFTAPQAINESAYPNFYDICKPTMTHFWTVVYNAQTFVPSVIDAGGNQSLSTNSTTVTATSIPSTFMHDSIYLWFKVSGPNGGTVVNPNSISTAITGLNTGIYKYKVKVTDNNGAEVSDSLLITVNSTPPTVDAGNDTTITIDSVTVTGTATGNGASITSVSWTQTFGPNSAIIRSPNSNSTIIVGLIPGTYTFRFTANDSNGASNFDTIQITMLEGATNILIFSIPTRVIGP